MSSLVVCCFKPVDITDYASRWVLLLIKYANADRLCKLSILIGCFQSWQTLCNKFPVLSHFFFRQTRTSHDWSPLAQLKHMQCWTVCPKVKKLTRKTLFRRWLKTGRFFFIIDFICQIFHLHNENEGIRKN